jgi:type IV pilus assembly protein PilW
LELVLNYKKMSNSNNSNGITLIELVIAMFIAGIVSIAIFTAFKSQQKSYLVQDQVAEMQQNVRASMDIMARDIRMAGYDPKPSLIGWPTILSANSSRINITMDINGDDNCSSNEDITYGFSNINDANADGIADAGAADLGRDTGGGFQPLAENIQAIGFAYAYSANVTTGVLDTSPNGNIIWAVDTDGDGDWDRLDDNDDGVIAAADGPGVGHNGIINGFDTGIPVNTGQIRAVRIWILSRADREDPDFRNTKTYVVGSQVITPNDGFRRRLLTTTVQCRNMGL